MARKLIPMGQIGTVCFRNMSELKLFTISFWGSFYPYPHRLILVDFPEGSRISLAMGLAICTEHLDLLEI